MSKYSSGFNGDGRTALRVIVSGVIDPRADRVRSHHPRIVRFKLLGHRSHVRESDRATDRSA
jgi:hypothetical protein